MDSLNSLSGALGLSVVAMSMVFLVLGGLALMMVLIKYVARVLEGAPKVEEVGRSLPSQEKEEAVLLKEELPRPVSLPDLDGDIVAIAAAIAAFSGGRPYVYRVWRVPNFGRSLWRESAKIESMIGGIEHE